MIFHVFEIFKTSRHQTTSKLGIQIIQNEKNSGIWVDHPIRGKSKIGFIGIRIRKGISFHGLSLNISPNLKAFSKLFLVEILMKKSHH